MISIFSKKDFRSEVIQQFITQIPDLEQKKKIIKEWQAAIESGKIYQLSETQQDISFINQIFGQVLGYDYQNSEKWNIEIKPKTDTDSTKPDAVLGYFGTEKNETNKRISCAVIELKSATQHLDKIQHRKDFKGSAVEQAFRYAHKLGSKCNWIIVSNFIEIRLYHASDSSKYENFEVQTLLNPQNFERFMYLLYFQNLFLEKQESIIDKLFAEKREEEKVISTEFYNGYAAHREVLFYNLLRTNTSYKQKPLELLSLTQIIIDRFLFICFVRDTIPLLDILGIVKNQTLDKLTAREDYFWREIKDVFVSLDKGFSHRIPRLNIPKFNGGLFSHNEKLNELYVHDDFLISFVSFLLEYDFESQLNVTILGHIFEQSIADLEELKTQIQEKTQGKKQDDIPTEKEILEDFDRRKKDGIFYTPNYITKQIIKNSVGKWLEDKRNTLLEKHKTETKEFWLDYSQQLKTIKIIDPACGSGAFLTEVVLFLATEWKIIEKELENYNPKKTNGNSTGMFSGISTSDSSKEWQRKREIIDTNIFGVDLNFESVEITKLSLWIMSANKTVSLSNLSENIKQGNSLIGNKKITSNAFDWNKNFATKFDIIIGNPPYGASFSESETAYIRQNYQTAEYQINSYVVFYEKALQLLNQNGYLGFITPNTFTYQHFFTKLRSYFSSYSIDNLTKHAYKVFEDANVGDTISWIIKNETQNQTVHYRITTSKEEEEEKPFLELNFEQFVNPDGTYNIGNSTFLKNLYENTLPLSEIVDDKNGIVVGIKAYEEGKGIPKQTRKTVNEKPFTATKAVDETFLRCVNGKDFHRYHFVRKPPMFLSYGKWLGAYRPSAPFFEEEKIIIRQTSDSLICHLDTNKYINLNNVYNIANPKEGYSLKYILAILNSKLMNYIYQSIAQEKGKLFAEVKKVYLKKLPIKSIECVEKETQNEMISLVETLLEQSEKLTSRSNAFLKVVESSFKPTKITEKLGLWYELEWTEFVEELKNVKAIIPKKDLIEWVSIFEDEKTKLSDFYNQQQSCILKIDELVYQIYGVEKEEIEEILI